jgi:hypothetical protein
MAHAYPRAGACRLFVEGGVARDAGAGTVPEGASRDMDVAKPSIHRWKKSEATRHIKGPGVKMV